MCVCVRARYVMCLSHRGGGKVVTGNVGSFTRSEPPSCVLHNTHTHIRSYFFFFGPTGYAQYTYTRVCALLYILAESYTHGHHPSARLPKICTHSVRATRARVNMETPERKTSVKKIRSTIGGPEVRVTFLLHTPTNPVSSVGHRVLF